MSLLQYGSLIKTIHATGKLCSHRGASSLALPVPVWTKYRVVSGKISAKPSMEQSMETFGQPGTTVLQLRTFSNAIF